CLTGHASGLGEHDRSHWKARVHHAARRCGSRVALQRIGPVAAETTSHWPSTRKLEGGWRAVLQRLSIRHARTRLSAVEVHTVDEISTAIQTFVREHASIVIVLASAKFVNARRQIATFALVSRLPTIYNFREHVEDGGLISYGIDLRQNYRRAAYFV